MGIYYISHKLSEIFEICDRITILRDGEYIATHRIEETTQEIVVQEMVGRELSSFYPEKNSKTEKTELLRVEGLTRKFVFEDIRFSLKKGEILGLCGLVGSGRTEIARGLCGIDKTDGGTVWLDGEKINIKNYASAIRNGLCYLTENRKLDGLFLEMNIVDNICALQLDHFSQKGIMQAKEMNRVTDEFKKSLNIKYNDKKQLVNSLSGGNQQKIMIAKLLALNPRIIILDEPTRGIDVGSKSEIHNVLRELSGHGIGIIMISSEMPEIVGVCDRVIIIREGRLVHDISGHEVTQKNIIAAISKEQKKQRRGNMRKSNQILSKIKSMKELTILSIIIVFVIVISVKSPVFLSADNIVTTAMGLSTTSIVGIGVTIALIGGCFDLSVGSVMGLASVLTVLFAQKGMNIWLAVLLSFLICGAIGTLSGVLVGRFNLNGFITTFAISQMARGLVFVLTEGFSITLPAGNESFRVLGTGDLFGILPVMIVIFLAMAVIADFCVRKTALIRKVFYVGSSEKAAILSGINSGNVKIFLYIGTASMSAIAGILSVSRFGVATANNGNGVDMMVLSAAVIGGTSLGGGKGTILGTTLGIVMLSIMNNALVLFNISVNWQNFVSGAILLIAIIIDYISNRQQTKRR